MITWLDAARLCSPKCIKQQNQLLSLIRSLCFSNIYYLSQEKQTNSNWAPFVLIKCLSSCNATICQVLILVVRYWFLLLWDLLSLLQLRLVTTHYVFHHSFASLQPEHTSYSNEPQYGRLWGQSQTKRERTESVYWAHVSRKAEQQGIFTAFQIQSREKNLFHDAKVRRLMSLIRSHLIILSNMCIYESQPTQQKSHNFVKY